MTLDFSNGNVLTELPLPAYITASTNAGGLTGGYISILSSDFSISTLNFYISIQGTFAEATQSPQY